MVSVQLDSRGQLIEFQAVPPQLEQPSASVSEAGLDARCSRLRIWTRRRFKPPNRRGRGWRHPIRAKPGRVHGRAQARPLRVEAAALRGKPVAFALIGPWKVSRSHAAHQANYAAGTVFARCFIGVLAVIICIGAALLARYNLASGRGDRRGAFRLAIFVFCLQMLLWLTRSHFAVSFGLVGMFLLALCTSSFYGVLMWTVYLALEPFVRRYWPKTLVSWTRVLSGRFNDPIVGRDVLFGAAMGVVWTSDRAPLGCSGHLHQVPPTWTSPDLLLGVRNMLGAWLSRGPHAVRDALLFFFVLFLLRVLLRNQWFAAAVFTLVFAAVSSIGSSDWLQEGMWNLLIYASLALVVLRFGLLALAAGVMTAGFLGAPPSLQASAWYFGNLAFLTLSAVALIVWAFYTSMGGRRAWSAALLGG